MESSIIIEFMEKFIWQHNLLVGCYGTFKMPPGRLDFWSPKGKKRDPPVTPKLKVREVSQSGFWNISWHPTSVPSFSQICWPQLLAPRTLSQIMTLTLASGCLLFSKTNSRQENRSPRFRVLPEKSGRLRLQIFQLTSASWFCLYPIFSENNLMIKGCFETIEKTGR